MTHYYSIVKVRIFLNYLVGIICVKFKLRIYCTGITVYLIATGISAILNHIPGINKYVV